MSIGILNKYEQINKSIKNNIYLSIKEFKNNKDINIIPLRQAHIKNEISKESKPIIFSLKNHIKLGMKKSKSSIDFFKFTDHDTKDIKNNINNIKTKIEEINNKIIILINEYKSKQILIKKLKEKNQKIKKLSSNEKNFIQNYENININISYITINHNEILNILKENENIRNKNNYLLNNLKKDIKALLTKVYLKNKDTINEIKSKTNIPNEIIDIKFKLENIKKDLIKINENRKYNQIINELKLIINRNKIRIENDIYNRINLSSRENEIIIKKIKNNNNKFNYFKVNIKKFNKKTYEIETNINDLKLNSILKNEFDNINNNKNKQIYNLNQNYILLNYELESLTQKIDGTKKSFLNYTYKSDFYNFINNLEKIIEDIKTNFLEKINLLEENKNKYQKIITSNIKTRKNKLNEIEKEKNNINLKLLEIQSIIQKNNDNNHNYNNDYITIKNNHIEFNNFLEKMYEIKIQINSQKKQLYNFINKLNDIEKRIKNEPFKNISNKRTLKKSMSSYIFEEKKYVNELNIQKIINKKRRNDLILYLNNIIKNLINKKCLLYAQMNYFINKQNKINKRNEEKIKYNNEMIDLSTIDNLKKIKNIKDNVYNVVEKYIKINRINSINKMKINDTKLLINEKEIEINKDFKDIKSYLDSKIRIYNINNK